MYAHIIYPQAYLWFFVLKSNIWYNKGMIDQKIVDYIKDLLIQNKSKEEIYKELLNQGHTVDDIQESFDIANAKEKKEDNQKRVIQIMVMIGAILISAGVFSFIAANWQEMAKPIKVSIIIIAMLISYGLGWYFKEKSDLVKTGEALILLGSIIYGAGIFLVAQMFNIRANWPDGFILWMIGTIVMAYAIESYSLFYLAIPLGFIAIIGHPFGIFTNFGSNPFILTSSFLLLAATVVTFITGWIIHKKMSKEFKELY